MGISKYMISEFLCAALLVSCTCFACSTIKNDEWYKLIIAYGLIHFMLLSIFGQISGAYANPAIVFALWWRGCMSIKTLALYTIAEISGAITGHYLINKMLGKAPSDALCTFATKSTMTDMSIMSTEFLLTFILILSWCALWDYEGDLPMEWYLAAANALVCILGGCLTGASTNPARTIAPAIFATKPDRTHFCLAGQYLAGIAAPLLWGQLQYWIK